MILGIGLSYISLFPDFKFNNPAENTLYFAYLYILSLFIEYNSDFYHLFLEKRKVNLSEF